MSIRDQIRELRGEWITKTVAETKTEGRHVELVALGYENYPEPSFWHVVVNGEIVSNWGNYNDTIYEARDEKTITNTEAIALELQYASVEGFGW